MNEEHSDIITMEDMANLFDVTDSFGIDRESIQVELSKEDPGMVNVEDGGALEITLPLSGTIKEWSGTLRITLARLGYTQAENLPS